MFKCHQVPLLIKIKPNIKCTCIATNHVTESSKDCSCRVIVAVYMPHMYVCKMSVKDHFI